MPDRKPAAPKPPRPGRDQFRRVPVGLLDAATKILEALALDLAQEGKHKASGLTGGIAYRCRRIIDTGDWQ